MPSKGNNNFNNGAVFTVPIYLNIFLMYKNCTETSICNYFPITEKILICIEDSGPDTV